MNQNQSIKPVNEFLSDSAKPRRLTRFIKNSQERARENKTQQIILVHPFTRATFSPLYHCKDFHYKKIKPDQFTEIQPLATRRNTLLLVAKNLLNLQQNLELYRLHCINWKTPY